MGFFDTLFSPSKGKKASGNQSLYDREDEQLDILEDMYAMRSQNPDADLEAHYGWDNKLEYDTDGFDDKEDW